MASGKTCFNAAVYKRALSRFWLAALAYTAVLCFIVLTGAHAFAGVTMENDSADYLMSQIFWYFARPMIYAAAVAALAMAVAVHGWMFRKTSAAYIAALPVSREALLTSSILSGLTLLIVPCLVMTLCGLLLCGGLGAEYRGAFLCAALAVICMNIAFFGIASFCTAFTGNECALAALYVIALYGFVGLEAACRYVLQFLVYGASGSGWTLAVLSPVYYFGNYAAYTSGASALVTAELYALGGIGFAVLSVLFFRRRRMEATGDVVAVPALRTLFRWGLALAGTFGMALLMLKTIFNFSEYAYALSGGGTPARIALLLFAMMFGAAVGWFGADALMRKTLRVFDRHWKGLGVLCVLICAAVIACDADVFGTESYIPDADAVSYATVTGWGEYNSSMNIREKENIEKVMSLQRSILSHKNEYEEKYTASSMAYPLNITYYDENDEILSQRSYCYMSLDTYSYVTGGSSCIPTDENSSIIEDLTLYEDILNSPECVEQRTLLDADVSNTVISAGIYWSEDYLTSQHAVTITGDEFWELYDTCIYPDWSDGHIGQIKLVQDEDYFTESEAVSIAVSIAYRNYGDDESNVYSFGYYLSPLTVSERTNEWLGEHGVAIYTLAELYGVY